MKKLRNKKTGEIYAMWHICIGGEEITSVKQFNDTFEDYEPAEPLIKDDKVQKAIRAFCEVTQEKKRIFVIKQFGRGSAEFSVGGRYAIRLPLSYESMDALEDGRNYTLTELCGEEE